MIELNVLPIARSYHILMIGDRISGIGEDYVMLKVRVKNRDIQRGNSATDSASR
jgi:hypothetical protein